MSQEKDLLEPYVTNTDDHVFAIKNLSGMVGAVMARYSRAEAGFRETLLNEFVKEDQLKVEKASKLIERVLIAYGDDSVGELEGAHLSFEDISMLATKVIEHRRIGGSPIEQSTRYVRYDQKDPQTGYRYYTPSGLEGEARAFYRRHMDVIFDCYAQMWEPLHVYLTTKKPLEDSEYDLGEMGRTWLDVADHAKARKAFERTYKNDIKTKACDILRAFLPLATLANVGLFGNGRFFQHLISKMLTSELNEAKHLGERAFEELSKVIPHYVKRAAKLDYLIDNREAMKQLVAELFPNLDPRDTDQTTMVEPDHAFILEQLGATADPGKLRAGMIAEENLNFLAALVFPFARGSFQQIRDHIKALGEEEQSRILDTYYGRRRVRRDRPERGIEHGYPHTFDMVTEWAVYKDLMRHRMGTIQVQAWTPDMGFEMPWELKDAGLTDYAEKALAAAENLYQYLARHFPAEKEYAFLQGHKMRWYLGMNDRALMHMLELRTAPQGHPNYRMACRELHKLAAARFPDRMAKMFFVNHDDIYWSRGDSEARQRVKEAGLED